FVYQNTGAHPLPSTSGLLTTIAWQDEQSLCYALDGGIFAAGSAIEWFCHSLGLLLDPKDTDDFLTRLKCGSSEGVLCIPALSGLAAPHWSRDARAAWLGMGLHTKPQHLLWSLLEGI